MPDTTFLHIQSRDPSTTRVLELSGLSVRIGLGAQCEVRLPDPDLSEVQCLLRRRGESWHVQPVGPSGRLSLDGRPVEQQRLLPVGQPLRVGGHWLTLNPADAPGTGAALGTYLRPILVERADPRPMASSASHQSVIEPSPLASTPEPPLKTKATAASSPPRREPVAPMRPAEPSVSPVPPAWGEQPRAAASRAAPVPPPSSQPTARTPTPTPSPRPPRETVENRPRTWSWGQSADPLRAKAAPVAPIVPPLSPTATPTPPPRPAPEAAGFRASPTRPPPRPFTPTATPSPSPLARPRPAPTPDPKLPTTFRAGETTVSEILTPRSEPDTRTPEGPLLRLWHDPVPLALAAPTERSRPAIEESETDADRTASIVPPPLFDPPVPGGFEVDREVDLELEIERGPHSLSGEGLVSIGPAEAVAEGPPYATETAPGPSWFIDDPEYVAPAFVADTAQSGEEAPGQPWSTTGPVSDAAPTEAPRLPSIRDILADHPRAPIESRTPRVHGIQRRDPQPTTGRRPAEVRVPAWMALSVACAACLVLIAAGLGLSCLQAIDDKEAGLLANALLGGPTLPPRPPYRPGASAPPTSWWMTSPRRLFLEALSESRLPASPERDAVVASRLDAARAIAPLDPPTRLARAEMAGGPTLGLTSDIISARATGRLLLKEGKIESALVVYQRAFKLLDTARPEDAAWPVFDDAANVRRFHLPLEDQVAEMLTDILDAEGIELTEPQLNALMPPDPVLRLAAARVLGERGRPEADAMRHWARDNPLPDPDSKPIERALALAARAEALALDDRLEEAAASYQEAVDLVPTKRLQRCWALNLAELEARLDHRESRDQAWELARGADPRDPVNLRLAEARQRHAGSSLTAIASDRPVSATRDDQLLRAAGP